MVLLHYLYRSYLKSKFYCITRVLLDEAPISFFRVKAGASGTPGNSKLEMLVDDEWIDFKEWLMVGINRIK